MKKFILGLLAFGMLSAPAAIANSTLPAKEFVLNQGSANGMNTVQLGTDLVRRKVQVLRATFDMSVLGGSLGVSTLRDETGKPAWLPAKSVIRQVWVDVVTQPTSTGAANFQVGAESASDLAGGRLVSNMSGVYQGSQAASVFKLTNPRHIRSTLTGASVLGGKFHVFVEYHLSE